MTAYLKSSSVRSKLQSTPSQSEYLYLSTCPVHVTFGGDLIKVMESNFSDNSHSILKAHSLYCLYGLRSFVILQHGMKLTVTAVIMTAIFPDFPLKQNDSLFICFYQIFLRIKISFMQNIY